MPFFNQAHHSDNAHNKGDSSLLSHVLGKGIVLRHAQSSDLDALVSLEHQCFTSDRLSRRSFRRFIRGDHSQCLVLSRDEQCVGYAVVLFRKGSSLARIYSLAVSPSARQGGLGKALLHGSEQAAKAQHCLFVRLEVRADNPTAIALYQAQGYRAFAREADYYEDGETAIKLEKSLVDSNRQSTPNAPFFAQTTPFTCGPASLMMAMASLAPNKGFLDDSLELALWREATTIYMTTGHGGCSPEGLAVSAWKRGFNVALYCQSNGVPFIDSVRDEQKKAIITRVHNDFVTQINNSDIAYYDTAISPTELAQYIANGAAIVTLISTWRLNGNKEPHWVTVTHADEHFVYLNDPDIDPDSAHPSADNIGLPIRKDEFERMACFGRRKLKATLVLTQR